MDRSNTVPTAIAFIVFIGLIIGGFIFIKNNVDKEKEKSQMEAKEKIGELPNIIVNVNGSIYTIIPDITYASQSLVSHLPFVVEMNDADGNKKQGCTYLKFDGEGSRSKTIKKGDVLIYGDSCVVIATGDFDFGNKYRKIGHINNLDILPAGNYTVAFNEAN